MNKTRQQELLRWLRLQRRHGGHWLHLTTCLGMVSALLIVWQAWLIASLLQYLIIDKVPRTALAPAFLWLLACFVLRALIQYLRDLAGFRAGLAIRRKLRQQVLDRLASLGPAWVKGKPAGSWATLLLEQIEEMQDYYARYLPQLSLAALIPCIILITLFPLNWAAGLILLVSAPLIPFFMALVGMGAAEANRRNFQALARLSGDFLDRLRGRDTLQLFHRATAEQQAIANASEDFRTRTMEVLRLAFLSSAVLEFFASLAIAVVAVYFGFSYLGELNFGHYGTGVTLFSGFLALILAPEFFQPLRDLGTFYHAKAQAVGGADALQTFMAEAPEPATLTHAPAVLPEAPFQLEAKDLVVTTIHGKALTSALSFSLSPGERVLLIGTSGAGKSALMNVLLGFLPYSGSLKVNGIELRDIAREQWQQHLAWVGQNPQLPAPTLRQNIVLSGPEQPERLQQMLDQAGVSEFLARLPDGLDTATGDAGIGLSVGQAQRVAVARALYKPAALLLLDEPTASLDQHSERLVMHALTHAAQQQTTLMISHDQRELHRWDRVWVMQQGTFIFQGSAESMPEALMNHKELA
ncbi:heme ABC transporter permease/ATP-binding protein CydD [Candidatus Pantoea multigeneris]|uniref:ABC-type xenobiotic transporter n=1 Tax=Candidatus Pantoea multigeneris TaxID=2608357 RepID=A0ABX0REM5_9GAMM|nr:cysteine/glutathione ABC transporter permease/ATP-binding protein CydD [Pantoea multigeneris]NIF22847.1 cysteine/glutathione ABC transporter permease/ATP-binding protein CydD [Pantoea multigeneris]